MPGQGRSEALGGGIRQQLLRGPGAPTRDEARLTVLCHRGAGLSGRSGALWQNGAFHSAAKVRGGETP